MGYRTCIIALGLASFALTVGCDKGQSKEEIIAEYEASRVEQERVAKLEDELAALKEDKVADAQLREDQQKALEKQLQDVRQKAAQAQQNAKALETKQPAPVDPSVPSDQGEARRGERRKPTVIDVPQGTKLVVSLSSELSTDTHNAGDSWDGALTQPVSIDGNVVWAAGTRVSGVVSQSAPTGRLANGQGALGIKLTEVGGASIDGGIFVVTGDSKGGRNTAIIGGTAALGALAGILADKNNKQDHALGGAAIGAAVGTAIAAGTSKTTIKIPSATPIEFAMPAAEQIVVRNR
ncbi:MAG: hypothetical protein LBQ86_01285 [Holophagales bacterium]|nr:hypothetical protein [Holophagales bacterium]